MSAFKEGEGSFVKTFWKDFVVMFSFRSAVTNIPNFPSISTTYLVQFSQQGACIEYAVTKLAQLTSFNLVNKVLILSMLSQNLPEKPLLQLQLYHLGTIG